MRRLCDICRKVHDEEEITKLELYSELARMIPTNKKLTVDAGTYHVCGDCGEKVMAKASELWRPFAEMQVNETKMLWKMIIEGAGGTYIGEEPEQKMPQPDPCFPPPWPPMPDGPDGPLYGNADGDGVVRRDATDEERANEETPE